MGKEDRQDLMKNERDSVKEVKNLKVKGYPGIPEKIKNIHKEFSKAISSGRHIGSGHCTKDEMFH